MRAVTDHYSQLLAPIYLWMAGGPQHAFDLGAADLAALQLTARQGATTVDLGCGFGMHAIPLARLGFAVTAIDTSALLLTELRRRGEGLGIRAIEDDLLDFATHATTAPDLIVCMGDTLTHLSSPDEVALLCARVADSLAPDGRFVTAFRDYTSLARGDARFIPVRSDADRMHTCFLEEDGARVLVHDIVHERQGPAWTLRASHYPKLRLDPGLVVRCLESHGLHVAQGRGPRGMVQVCAARSG